MCGRVRKDFRFFSVQTKEREERERKIEREVLALYPRLSVPVDGTCAPDAGS